jgi:hypothetical protein
LWGIGLILNGQWLTWELKENWKSNGRDIGWAEMAVVELAIQMLITSAFLNCHIVICSDNMGIISALSTSRSRGTQQNAVLREIVEMIQANSIWISMVWVPTTENPADAPSRGDFPSRSLLYAFPPKLPYHLRLFVHKSVNFHDPHITR